MDDAERRERILKLWFQRPKRNRTRSDLHKFYGELVENHLELLVQGQGDPYEQLKADLHGYTVNG